MKVKRIFYVLLVLALLLSVGVHLSQAQGREARGSAELQANTLAAKLASFISYQGVLKENGSPVTGNRDMNFKLYTTTDCSGVALQTVAKAGVQVANGLFSTTLQVTASNFNGQALYVQVEIGGTNISCQEILPVPYALSLRPGAFIGGSGAGNGDLNLLNSNDAHTIRLKPGRTTGELWIGANPHEGYILVGEALIDKDAGATTPILLGTRYRDNSIIAWAKVSSGAISGTNEFGVASITNPAVGQYDITLDSIAASAATLIPIAIAELDAQPNSAASVRVVSVNQTGVNTFSVYINNGEWAPVNNDFVFLVTAR